jgi:hypothetical protein
VKGEHFGFIVLVVALGVLANSYIGASRWISG